MATTWLWGDQADNYATPTRYFSFQFTPLVVTYKTFPQWMGATNHWNPTHSPVLFWQIPGKELLCSHNAAYSEVAGTYPTWCTWLYVSMFENCSKCLAEQILAGNTSSFGCDRYEQNWARCKEQYEPTIASQFPPSFLSPAVWKKRATAWYIFSHEWRQDRKHWVWSGWTIRKTLSVLSANFCQFLIT